MDRGNTEVAVCRRFLLSNRLVFAAFCCLCAVHFMQAAAASFVSPKAVFLACKIGSWTAKNSAQSALKVDTFRSKVKKIFWGGAVPLPRPSPVGRGKPSHQTSPPRRLRRLDTRAYGARPWPPVCNSWIRHWRQLKKHRRKIMRKRQKRRREKGGLTPKARAGFAGADGFPLPKM